MMNSFHSLFVGTGIVFFFVCSLVATTEAAGAVKLTKKKTKNKGRSSYKEQPPKDKYLAVQVGQSCTLRKDDDGGGGGGAGRNSIHLIVTTGTTLVSFTERPVRSAVTLGTEAFVQNFSKTFSTSKPNTAVTFASDGDKQGTLITKFSKANIVQTIVEDNSVVIDYTIQQVGSQGDNDMLSLLDLFDNTDAASVTLVGGCTLFIDSFPIDQYNSITDYCFNCGSGSKSVNCWTKGDNFPNNPQCYGASGTFAFRDNQCGNPCLPNEYVPGTKNTCYSCTDAPNCWTISYTSFACCKEISGVAANECGKVCNNGGGGDFDE